MKEQLQVSWLDTLSPTLFSKVHDDVRYPCGWARFFAMTAVILGRGIGLGNWDTFRKGAFLEEDSSKTSSSHSDSSDSSVWCWNYNVLVLLILCWLFEALEDLVVHYLNANVPLIAQLGPRVFGRYQRQREDTRSYIDQNNKERNKYDFKFTADPYHVWKINQWFLVPTNSDNFKLNSNAGAAQGIN